MKYRSKMFRDLLKRLVDMTGVQRWEIASEKMRAAKTMRMTGQVHVTK